MPEAQIKQCPLTPPPISMILVMIINLTFFFIVRWTMYFCVVMWILSSFFVLQGTSYNTVALNQECYIPDLMQPGLSLCFLFKKALGREYSGFWHLRKLVGGMKNETPCTRSCVNEYRIYVFFVGVNKKILYSDNLGVFKINVTPCVQTCKFGGLIIP